MTPYTWKPRTLAHLQDYAAFHQNPVNEGIHKIAVPLILATILVFLDYFPITFAAKGLSAPWEPVLPILGRLSWGHLAFVFLWGYYLFLDVRIGLFMGVYVFSFVLGKFVPWQGILGLFLVCWIFQFIGHGFFEKKSPAFFTTPWQLIIGPIYVMAVTTGKVIDLPILAEESSIL